MLFLFFGQQLCKPSAKCILLWELKFTPGNEYESQHHRI